MVPSEFKKIVWSFYKKNKRDLPWRAKLGKVVTPYHILVSEIMLQQTQVDRVVPKYHAFVKVFPTAKALAHAKMSEVLTLWSGLGYNRIALNLKKTATIITEQYKGKFPRDEKILKSFPGIGSYTAGALCAFAYNESAVLVETNIRTVYIHHFFPKSKKVTDEQILPLILKTIDVKNPREWYWALMDYGSFLKKENRSLTQKSAQFIKQTPFKGSNRFLRGKIMKYLVLHKNVSKKKLLTLFTLEERLRVIEMLLQLEKEGLIKKNGVLYSF